ncbi:hypothetical protein CFOL_v3_17142 [Cephalotus follicularis]|uniref:Transmembrane protein n=1 Tax=Cephalotus follicularis TaxID=3775 RepID=A0A1Q3C0H5_CEPFO|nr:hypothetical protein CFOL_v3_17142 [Cephalotus follicularis]
MAPSCEDSGKIEEKMGTQKVSEFDDVNGFQYTTEKADDSFVIDMDTFSQGNNKYVTANSRIKLQGSLSRKGSQRGGQKKSNVNSNTTANENVISPSKESRIAEKPAVMAVGPTDNGSDPQVHHQITITNGNISAITESRFALRRNSFKRSTLTWVFDPKRVLFFFAMLSSMGTILLIYFTLSVSKFNADGSALH